MPRELPHSKYQGIDLVALYKFTLIAARRKLQPHSWLGTTPDDITNSAFLALHQKWDPSRCSPQQFLYQRVVHEIDALCRKVSNRRMVVGLPENVVEFRDIVTETPEQVVSRRGEEKRIIAYIDLRHKGCAVLAQWILESNIKTSREFGEAMNLDQTQVEGLRKKLKKILHEYVSKDINPSSPISGLLKRIDGSK